jgi:hypothetical protein
MFKNTCLIALKRKDQSPRTIGLEILIYLILEDFICQLQNNSLDAQEYNHTNAIIIRIEIA